MLQSKSISKKCPSPKAAIFALALCAFGIGTTEFVTTGLLPELARYFHISIPMAGYVTSGYALGVVIGAPIITALTLHIKRKGVLLALMLLFVVGSLISALADSFGVLMLGRILSALCHGAFFGISAVVVANLVSPEKKASAIAMMFTGLTLANVLGVPLGTLLGQNFGWRSPFWVITLMGIIGLSGIFWLVPWQSEKSTCSLKHELAVFRRGKVWVALAVTVFGFGGLLASFGYISPMMQDVTGFSQTGIVWLLSLFGIGLVIGNILGGKAADKALNPTIYGSLGLLALVLLIFVFTVHYKIPAAMTLFALGVIGFGTIPALQMQIMHSAEGAETLASAANISAFNLGTTIGVFFGGISIHAGFGYPSVNWVGALITLLGLFLAMSARVFTRKGKSS